jgi:hypothetical protein
MTGLGASLKCHLPRRTAAYGSKVDPGKPSNGVVYELTPASPSSQKFKPGLYIQGVVNQNPGTEKNPVTLFNRGERIDANADVVLPAAIPGRLKFWEPELLKLPRTHAKVHSKVVVIDPYGTNPVVMTGSHNMGPKARRKRRELDPHPRQSRPREPVCRQDHGDLQPVPLASLGTIGSGQAEMGRARQRRQMAD